MDAIHHDVRYPGDLAPDTYCFCDYCLRELPKYASYASQVRPDDPLLWPMDRPHLEAHWERSPRVLPPNWVDYSREMRSRLLFEGSFFPGGNRDLDYFFYEYRVHYITEFTRLVFEAVRKVRPRIVVSAAVFKNPVQSGRFIGQDWRQFSPWVQYLMPMDYRSHYAGDFDAHLELLAESVQQQKMWARDVRHLWIGLAAYQLYEDERAPLLQLRDLAKAGGAPPEMRAAFDQVAPRLHTYAPDLHADLAAHLGAPGDTTNLGAKLEAFLASPPAGYFAPDKLLKTLERARGEQVEGIVIFSASGLTTHGLWDTVRDFFSR